MAKIVLFQGVPNDPNELREWLRKWHEKNNGIKPGDERPSYELTEKGRLLLGLGLVGSKN
jgi:hypothetical protein